MKYALITPLVRVGANPGWSFITAGIMHWLRARDDDATFMMIDMVLDDPEGWEIAEKQADKLVLCGNPRFNSTEEKTYHDWQIWERIAHAMDRGIPFIDAWAGSAWPFGAYVDAEDAAMKLLGIQKNLDVLAHERRAELLIARDRPTELLFKSVNPNTMFLPCSSVDAAKEYGIVAGPGEYREYDVILLRKMPGDEWILANAARLRKVLHRCRVVTVDYNGWKWAADLDPEYIADPSELLRLFSYAKEVHSFRLHASIPAFSLGATVMHYATDSRCLALEPFAIRSAPFTSFGNLPEPK